MSDERRASQSLAAPTVREGTPSGPRAPEPGGTGEPFAVGTVLAGRYRLLERIGAGGMGHVYRARDLTLDADIGLKILPPAVAADPDRLAIFRGEVRLARRVTHPNVCRLHDLEESGDTCFITMELVDGESLAQRLRARAPSLDEALPILRDVAAGLAAAHEAGIVHRDLKPSNVLVDRRGRAIIADFGIAGDRRELAEGPPLIAGTLGYMAPEQGRGDPVDARADVYAFGVLALVATTGTRPLPAHTTESPMGGGSAAALPVVDLAPVLAALPGWLARLVRQCLAEDKAERPADGAALVAALADGLEADAEDIEPARRLRWGWVVAAGLVAAAGIGAALLLRGARDPDPAPMRSVVVGPAVTTGLPEDERWKSAAIARTLADELVDAWGIESGAGEIVTPIATREPGERYRVRVGAASGEGATLREAVQAAATAFVAERVPREQQHPTAAELRIEGTTDAEAWRWLRRARRDAMMLRWERVGSSTREAKRRDPNFALAYLEEAMVIDRGDTAARAALDEAVTRVERADVDPAWKLAARAVDAYDAGRWPEVEQNLAAIARLELAPQTRQYIMTRQAIGTYYSDVRAAGPQLTLLLEQYPGDGAAPKMLASLYLDSDEPGADALALKYAEVGVKLAPDDAGTHCQRGIALARAGRIADAHEEARRVASMAIDDRRLARERLFELHLALGDPAEADADARRVLTGTPHERAVGISQQGLLQLYWGQFLTAYDSLEASAQAFVAIGQDKSADHKRYRLAFSAWQLGDTQRAQRVFADIASRKTTFAKQSRVFAAILAGNLPAARVATAAIEEGTAPRAIAEVKLAAVERRDEELLAAYARLERVGSTRDVVLDRADALARLGRRDDEIATLVRLTENPAGYAAPVVVPLALARLGDRYAQAKDVERATAAYTALLARWERADTRPEVERARRYLGR